MLKHNSSLPILFLSALLFQACEFDHGLGLSPSRISGKVIFVGTDDRPSNVEEVRVVAAARFPPTGVSDIFFSNAVDFAADSSEYEIILPYGNYQAIAVLWKPRNDDWALESLLGFYGFDPFTFQASLKNVELTEQNPEATDIYVPALWGFTTFDARVEGTLTYRGNWPEDTEIVVMGGFTQVPDLNDIGLAVLLSLGGINFTLPQNVTSYQYELAVRKGDYKFVGLFWKGRNIPWDKIRCIGFYPAANDSTMPGSFSLPPEGRITGIDFVADFNTLPDGVKLGGGR